MTTGQIYLGVITAIAAVAAALLAWWAGRQATGQRELQARREDFQARREEWWRRFQWATSLAISADERQSRVGVALMVALSDSSLASDDELAAMATVADEIYESPIALHEGKGDDEFIQVGTADEEGHTDDDPGHPVPGDGGQAAGEG